jgi:hypothetical protein
MRDAIFGISHITSVITCALLHGMVMFKAGRPSPPTPLPQVGEGRSIGPTPSLNERGEKYGPDSLLETEEERSIGPTPSLNEKGEKYGPEQPSYILNIP